MTSFNDILYGDGPNVRPLLGLDGLDAWTFSLDAQKDERGVWCVVVEEDDEPDHQS